ncbi:MAG: C40 family peptidase [Thermoleophilia bacterium]|nr:C40 family peptidase [Thermoleophilia bacterium]
MFGDGHRDQTYRRRLLALVLLALFLVALLPGLAHATTPAIEKAKKEAQALLELIEQLDQELGAATEEYNYATQQLQDTQAAVEKTTRELKQAQTDLALAQGSLDVRLVGMYKARRLDVLSVFLEATSFAELINRLDQFERVSRQDAALIDQVEAYRAQELERKAQLESQVEQQKVYAEQAAVARQKVLDQVAKQSKALAGKESQIAQLRKEEAARQAKLAAEARARKAFLASRPGKVISYAMDYLGVPYVWGGSSPRGFDCSGLVQHVYAKVGISLPHSSRMQYDCGTPVSQGQLRAGDLIFYYNPIQHVAIYMGDGKIIHATGSQVQIGNAFQRGYRGACRVLQ